MRGCDRATLATAQAEPKDGGAPDAGPEAAGWPYPSLALVALDHDGSPLLLLSNLAEHTRNIARDPRIGLLFDGTGGLAQPLTGARLSVLGRAARSDEPRHRARFLRRHPDAAFYAGFADFAVYRVAVERAHLVAGFGRIHWLSRDGLGLPGVPLALAEAETDTLAVLNDAHAAALPLLVPLPPGATERGEGWTLTGLDPEGCDLRCGGYVARVDFDERTDDPESARLALAALVQRAARSGGASGSPGGPR
ncbi:hypothetical protein [Azospirillum doebereinerae]